MKKFNFIIAVIAFWAISCSNSSNPNRLDSANYDSKEERVEVLKKEIKPFSNFQDAEFELFNVNGFANSRASLAGPSSWDYKFVIKVKPSDIEKWTNGMLKTEGTDYDQNQMKKIISKRADKWKTTSKPEFYTRQGDKVMMIVYRSEGILFKHIFTD